MELKECLYVMDVLDLFDLLQIGYQALPDKDGLTPELVRLPGFDGKNEMKRLSCGEYLRDTGK
jgi:uncharacterized protein YfbU (UPF0304 family)